MIQQLLPTLELPSSIPELPGTWITVDLEELTRRRRKQLTIDLWEKRAYRLIYKYGGRLRGLEGSQSRAIGSYYTELFTHEYAHCLHYGLTGKRPLNKDFDDAMSCRSKEENDENELRTSASTTLVLEYLGMPYNPYNLVWSTYRNLRVHRRLSEVWLLVMELRKESKVVEVARQIARLIAKIKYGET